MSSHPSPVSKFSSRDRVTILLAEYAAIQQMHAHYDVLNMSMTAVITAGITATWGLVLQAAFQAHAPIDNSVFVNSINVLALALFLTLSIWIRYATIHRCIVIVKLNRSYQIERELGMRQDSLFRYDAGKFSAPLDENCAVKRRPGGHSLELLLYLALSTLGGLTAFTFQLHLQGSWDLRNYILLVLLLTSPLLALLWAGFSKLDALEQLDGKVVVGFPWNMIFVLVMPINRGLRWFLNIGKQELNDTPPSSKNRRKRVTGRMSVTQGDLNDITAEDAGEAAENGDVKSL